MGFMDIPREQQQRLHILAGKAINALQDYASQQLSIKLDALQAFKVLVTYFKNRHEIPKHQLIKTFLQVLYGGSNTNVEALSSTILSNNFAGRVLRYQDTLEMEQYLVKCLYMIYQHSQQQSAKTKTMADKLFNERYQQIALDYAKMRYQRQRGCGRKIKQYLAYHFTSQQQVIQMTKEWKFDKKEIDILYYTLNRKINFTTRDKAILRIYEKHIRNNDDINLKYFCYQFIQYLATISNKQFTQEFKVDNDQQIEQVVRFIKEEDIYNLDELKMRVNIVKHLEESRIDLNFSRIFKVEYIPDDIIVTMLDNIENRIQYISTQQRQDFIILRRIQDNRIIKRMINDANKKEIKQLIQECNDGSVYDVVIISKYDKFESIGNIRMRYLNYNKWGNTININLNHPEDLLSLSSRKVKINNMNECVNLRNLYSMLNTYNKQDIQALHNLKRIYSYSDKYENEQNCLLHDLMESNRLEYVFIYNYRSDANIIDSITMSRNISNLRYFDVYQGQIKYDIKLNVQNEYPENMRVYYVTTYTFINYKYGTISGPEAKAQQLKQNLIHELKENN